MDELATKLNTMGHRIANEGCAAEPDLGWLATLASPIAPVAAAVLASETEPEIARSRAFLSVAMATERLTASQRRDLADALGGPVPTTKPTVARPAPNRVVDPFSTMTGAMSRSATA